MLRRLLVASVLLVSACSTPTAYTETADEVRIHFGGGGMLKGKRETYMKIRDIGKRVVIDGQVVSADAFYAFNLPARRLLHRERDLLAPCRRLSRFTHEGGWVSGFRVGSPGVAGCG